ncbi:Transcription-associated protein 1 like [Verticillium longisporum]|nr:Transcription-associated protein 1 like [Verticillium longisporum]
MPSDELSDEIEALNSIYGDGTLSPSTSSDAVDVYVLVLPADDTDAGAASSDLAARAALRLYIPPSAGKPFFHNPEPVPFRLTPNLQTLMGPLAMEGIFSCSLMAIARCLLEGEHELENALTLFVRDEMIFWFTSSHRAVQMTEHQLRESVQVNSDSIVKRATSLAQSPASNLPANQTVIDLIAKAVNPMNLAQCDALWMPYL